MSDSTITSIIEDRVFPETIPHGITGDAIVYQQIGESEDMTIEGALGLIESRWQFACITMTYPGSLSLAGSLRTCYDDYMGDVGHVNIHQIHVDTEYDLINIGSETELVDRYARVLDCEVSFSYD